MSTSTSEETVLSAAECEALARLMERKYAGAISSRSFAVALRKDGRGVYATVTLRNASGSFFYPVEGRMAHVDHNLSPRDAALLLLDHIDSYFAEFFREDGGVYLPIDWATYDADGVPFELKGQILNLEAERLADELLARHGGLPEGGRGDLH